MPGWVKSTFSSGSGECVEVRVAFPAVAVRDSKRPRVGSMTVPTPSWGAFLAMITSR
jgi:hypothetical protein